MMPEILYEDTHLIVCRKPGGTATQSGRVGEPDMVSFLKNYIYKQNQKAGVKKEPYVAVIHRLDQPVEGILVFAKTKFAAKELNSQLQKYGFGKHYRARVQGCPPKDEDTLVHYLVKNGRANCSRVCEKETEGAKKAVLHYKVRTKDADTSEIEIRLETGRHHQIRVQMAEIGCPLCGDQKYNEKYRQGKREQIALCAYRLSFTHPKTNQKLEFETKPWWEV